MAWVKNGRRCQICRFTNQIIPQLVHNFSEHPFSTLVIFDPCHFRRKKRVVISCERQNARCVRRKWCGFGKICPNAPPGFTRSKPNRPSSTRHLQVPPLYWPTDAHLTNRNVEKADCGPADESAVQNLHRTRSRTRTAGNHTGATTERRARPRKGDYSTGQGLNFAHVLERAFSNKKVSWVNLKTTSREKKPKWSAFSSFTRKTESRWKKQMPKTLSTR